MSGTAFTVGAELILSDKATPEMRRMIEMATRLDELMLQLQGRFDKLGLGGAVGKIKAEWNEIADITSMGADKVMKSMAGMGTEGAKAFRSMVAGASDSFGEILTSSVKMQGDVLEEIKALSTGSVEALKGIGAAAPAIFDPLVTAASASAAKVEDIMRTVSRSVEGSAARMNAAGSSSAVAAIEGHASLRDRTLGGHHANNAHAGGMHFGRMGTHVGGAHVGMGGDGIVQAISGGVILEMLKKGVEEGWDMDHWASGFAGAGFSAPDIDKAKRAAWANAGRNPNASAIDGMKNILELNKATGNLDESIELLPLFSKAEMAMQSVKAEGLHSKFTGGNQILNLAKGLEEMGYTTKGETPEERQANVEKATNELIRTMVSSRGLFDGNKLFAMTNNSGGAAQNWDLRFGTTIAPIIGDIMNHSKLGNAYYMSLKSFQGGHITPDAVDGLMKYKMVDQTDVYSDSKGKWHLKANSNFAKGMESNLYDWSGGVLERLQRNGYDINDQKFMNGIVNEIGSNKSNSMLMRAVLEPGTRKQIQKEIDLRDKVPDDVAGVLQKSDPVLKLDALHKKTQDFLAALGGPLTDPAIAALTKLTAGINALAQAAEAHPDITKGVAGAAGVAGLGLFGYGAGKMLGVFGGGDAGLGIAATKLDAAADHLMLVGGGVPGAPGGTVPGKPGGKGPGTALAEGTISGFLYQYGVKAIDSILGWTPENQKTLDHATSLPNVWKDVKEQWFGAAAGVPLPPTRPGLTYDAPNTDGNALHKSDEMPAGFKKAADAADLTGTKFGALNTNTGLVLTSFDGLKAGGLALNGNFKGLSAGSGGLDNAFRIVEATAMGAARALATVAMSGGIGGGSGLINASWGGGGGSAGDGSHPLGGYGGGSPGSYSGGGDGSFKGGATAGKQSLLARQSYDFWRAHGLDHAHAIGMVVQEQAENNFSNTPGDFVRGRPTAFGPFQFHGDRARLIKQGTGIDVTDPNLSHADALRAAFYDATKGGRAGFMDRYMKQATGLDGSSDYATRYFEGPKALFKDQATRRGYAHMWDTRGFPGAVATTGVPDFVLPKGGYWAKDSKGNPVPVGPDGSVVPSYRPAPIAGPPPQSKTVTSGRPAGKQAEGRMLSVHLAVPVHVGNDKITHHVVHQMVAAMEHPNSVGGPDTYGTHCGPDVALNDCA